MSSATEGAVVAPRLVTRSKMRDFLERFMVHVLVAVDDGAFNLLLVHCNPFLCHVFEGSLMRKSVACNQVTYLVCDLG